MGTTNEPTGTPANDGNNSGATSTADGKPGAVITMTSEQLRDRLERAKPADYEDLKAKAQRLDELEAANKPVIERLTNEKTAAEQAAAEAKAEALRWKIAAKHKLSDDDAELFLTGTDEETLERQAKALAERTQTATPKTKSGNYVPAEGTQPNPPGPDPLRDLARQVFGRPD